jgi:hypothetical protein
VCRVCCGPAPAPHALCFACRLIAARLGLPLAPVLPVRLCPLRDPLYAVLMGYKESPVAEARRRFAPLVRDLVASFLAAHGRCVAAAAGGPIDHVLAVPSTARPAGPPLAALEGLGAAVRAALPGACWAPRLLRRAHTSAPAAVGHMRPDARAFEVAPAGTRAETVALRGTSALLLDDTYVSGARSQSAAAALRRAGVATVVIVPVGRVLRPDRSAVHDAFLRAHRAPATTSPGSVQPCARCIQVPASTE